MGCGNRLGFEVGLHDSRVDQSEVLLCGFLASTKFFPLCKIVFFLNIYLLT
jgi:hypothetical protein